MYQRPMNVGDLKRLLAHCPNEATVLLPNAKGDLVFCAHVDTTSNDPTGGGLGISGVILRPYVQPEEPAVKTLEMLSEGRF